LLSACIGGESDSPSSVPDPSTFVSGSFKDASVTVQAFPRDRATHGFYGSACVDQDNYFETDSGRVRIYGSTAFSENDFKAMATLVDGRLNGSLAKMGLSWEELKLDRPIFTAGTTNYLLSEMSRDADVFNLEPQPDTLPPNEGDAYQLWKTMTDQEQRAYADKIRAQIQSDIDEYGLPEDALEVIQELSGDFVIGCLSPEMGGSTFGEGSLAGVLMPPNYRQWPNRVAQIVEHELIHFAQNNLMLEAGYGYLATRWFTEGQAVYLAGQKVASPANHHNYEPQTVFGFYDEYGDIGMAYEHYGLAYRYIHDHNSMASINEMLRLMKETLHNPLSPESNKIAEEESGAPLYGESMAFKLAFDATMVDHNGDPLTIDRFRTNYHDLMNAAY